MLCNHPWEVMTVIHVDNIITHDSLLHFCEKYVICQTKTAWGCKKGALPSKVESLV